MVLKIPGKNLKTKIILLVGSVLGSYFLGEAVGEWTYAKFLDDNKPQPYYNPETTTNSKPSRRQEEIADIWVDDVEREEIKRKQKTLKDQVFFWKKQETAPVAEDDAPNVPAWSDAYKKKQNYDEDYGL